MLHDKHHSEIPNGPDGCSNIACCQLPIATDEVFSADVRVTRPPPAHYRELILLMLFNICVIIIRNHKYT